MAGKIHSMIEMFIDRRSQGNPIAASGVRVRLLLRGIDPDDYGPTSEDDPEVIARLEQLLSDPEMTGART